jgi:hypothetical protein
VKPAGAAARSTRRVLLASGARLALALMLGVAAAVLVACGSTGKGLIPAASGGPLQGDIEAVDQAAQEANGNCSATEAALLKTDQDYAALPSTVNSELRNKLRLGIENLHKVAKEACLQPLAQTTTTAAPKTTTTTTPPPTTTTPPPTTTTTTPANPEGTESPEGAGGGTPAPGEGNGKAPSEGSGGAAPPEEDGKAKGKGNGVGGKESGE